MLICGELPIILIVRCISKQRYGSLSLVNANSSDALFDYILVLWFVLQFDNFNLVLDLHYGQACAFVIWMNVIKYLTSKCLGNKYLAFRRFLQRNVFDINLVPYEEQLAMYFISLWENRRRKNLRWSINLCAFD